MVTRKPSRRAPVLFIAGFLVLVDLAWTAFGMLWHSASPPLVWYPLALLWEPWEGGRGDRGMAGAMEVFLIAMAAQVLLAVWLFWLSARAHRKALLA
jgi:hypothetical protein